VTLSREPVLLRTRNLTFRRDVFCRIAHRAVLERAPKPVVNECVVRRLVAVLEAGPGTSQQEGRAAHALHPARDDEIRVAGADSPPRDLPIGVPTADRMNASMC